MLLGARNRWRCSDRENGPMILAKSVPDPQVGAASASDVGGPGRKVCFSIHRARKSSRARDRVDAGRQRLRAIGARPNV
jgi:hypothetical protein